MLPSDEFLSLVDTLARAKAHDNRMREALEEQMVVKKAALEKFTTSIIEPIEGAVTILVRNFLLLYGISSEIVRTVHEDSICWAVLLHGPSKDEPAEEDISFSFTLCAKVKSKWKGDTDKPMTDDGHHLTLFHLISAVKDTRNTELAFAVLLWQKTGWPVHYKLVDSTPRVDVPRFTAGIPRFTIHSNSRRSIWADEIRIGYPQPTFWQRLFHR